jgi:hypothetical protein
LSNKVKNKREEILAEIKLGTANIALNFGVPVRSGDLKRSFKLNQLTNGSIEIKTNIEYMPYTNEPWISPKWKGAVNPNEKWFDETAEFMAKAIARHTGGRYVRIK